jgi:hypothetical protein
MITGTLNIKNERDYRQVPLDSSSSLKDFSMDRKKYQKKYILLETIIEEEEDSKSSVVGKIVECLLLEPELFDSRFHMSACAKAPTGKMLDFVNALCKLTIEAADEKGVVTRSFEEMAVEARTIAEFDWSLKVILGKFTGMDPEIYYNELLQVKAKSLIVVTVNDVTNAEKIVEELKTNPITKDIVGLVDSKHYTIKKQYQIEGFKIDSHVMKAMMDLVIVDHFKQTIQVYDLKCTWNVENFYENYFLFRRSHIQAFVYYAAAVHMTKTIEEYKDYKVFPPQFIVCDSTNYYSPLIYTLTEKDLEEAYDGFEYRGKKYNGVKTIIADLKWALQENCWNISRENYLSNGIVKLK